MPDAATNAPPTVATATSVPVVQCGGLDDSEISLHGFDDMYRAEYPRLVAVAAALTGDRDGAQDLAQDTLVKALIRWERVSTLDSPGAWCQHVIINACRSRLRRRVTELRFLASLRRSDATVAAPSPDTVAFWEAVRKLPTRPRTVVALYFAADLSSVQIAALLRIPEGTVRTDLAAARRVVMRELRN